MSKTQAGAVTSPIKAYFLKLDLSHKTSEQRMSVDAVDLSTRLPLGTDPWANLHMLVGLRRQRLLEFLNIIPFVAQHVSLGQRGLN